MKKGQLFSLMAVFMSALFIVIFSSLTHVPLNKNVDIIETEISRFGSLAESIDYFVSSSLSTSSYLFLNASVDKIYTNCDADFSKTPTQQFNDFLGTFKSCLEDSKDGGWDCNPKNIPFRNMSYEFQLNSFVEELENRYGGLDLIVSTPEIDVELASAFSFNVMAKVNVQMNRDGYSWNRYFDITREIPVIGLNDPSLAARCKLQPITLHPDYSTLLTVASLASSNSRIYDVVENGYYFRDKKTGLSLVSMFEGDLLNVGTGEENDDYGINSILNPHLFEVNDVLDARTHISLLETQQLAGFYFNQEDLLRFDPEYFFDSNDDSLRIDDDVILSADLMLRLDVSDSLAVSSAYCFDDGTHYVLTDDGACDSTRG